MKVKDVEIKSATPGEIPFILTKDRKCVSYNLHNAHTGFEDCEIKSLKVEEHMGTAWIWAELEAVPDDVD